MFQTSLGVVFIATVQEILHPVGRPLKAGEFYGSLCNKLITIVNYYLETGLSCIVY